MKKLIPALLCGAVALLVFPIAIAGTGYGVNEGFKANAGFEKLKSLAGVWETTGPDGKPATVSYAVVSNGSAVMETISHGTESDMITVYTVDGGDHLMMTHYCGLGNQPRMRASVPAGDVKELTFKFVGGSNMKKSDMHMHGLVMKFTDDSHVEAIWSLYDKGKLQNDHAFSMTRKS